MKTYKFDYKITVPVRGGSNTVRHGRKQSKGHCALNAADKLRESLSKKWADPVTVEILGGIILGADGFIPVNPDILPHINRTNPHSA